MKIVGVGLNKTGTKTLGTCLRHWNAADVPAPPLPSEAAVELSRVELRDLSTGTVVMSTDPAWKPPAPKLR